MRRREFIRLIAGASVAWPFAAMAQEPGRTYRLGLVSPLQCERTLANFSDAMRSRGFVEGRNFTISCRYTGPQVDAISEYAVELVKAKVDVIYAGGELAIRAAQQMNKTIPIIGVADDMVGSGLVNSMARPNGNTTGVSILATELDGKRQEILIEAVPGLRRMAALAHADSTQITKLDTLQEAARARNIELSIHRIARAEEIPAAIDMAKASSAEALNVLASAVFYVNRQLIMDRVAALRLPAIYQWAENAEEGGFLAYGPRILSIIPEYTSRQLVKLFQGIRVADIPVEQPTKFELVINLKTANALGVTVPPILLARADKVIE